MFDVAVGDGAAHVHEDLAPCCDQAFVPGMVWACAVAGQVVVAVGIDAVPAAAAVAPRVLSERCLTQAQLYDATLARKLEEQSRRALCMCASFAFAYLQHTVQICSRFYLLQQIFVLRLWLSEGLVQA